MTGIYLGSKITIEERNGYYHAFSKDMPGFHLCADSLNALTQDIPAALDFFGKVKQSLQLKAKTSSLEGAVNHNARHGSADSDCFAPLVCV